MPDTTRGAPTRKQLTMTEPSTTNTVTTLDQVHGLPAGQWAQAEDGKAYCLFDTHMGFPQRMWGYKPDGGTKGLVYGFASFQSIQLPLHLGDVDVETCLHRQTNECGQCLRCGKPDVVEGQPLFFSDEDGALIRAVAENNSRITEATR